MKIEGAENPAPESVKTGDSLFFSKRKRDDLEGERLPRDERFFKFTHRETEDDENPFNEEGTEQ